MDSLRLTLQLRQNNWIHSVVYLPETTSTNSELLQQAGERNVSGLALVSDYQTAGRGRLGRSWLTPRGQQLAISFAVGVDRFSAPQLLPLAAGVAVVQTLEVLGIAAQLKWPNDVLVSPVTSQWAKLCGILVEVSPAQQYPSVAVIGMGINLQLSEETRNTISSTSNYPALGIANLIPDHPDLQYRVCEVLFAQLDDIFSIVCNDPAALVARYSRYCRSLDSDIVVHISPESPLGTAALPTCPVSAGQVQVPVYARGITPAGQLIVDFAGESFEISSADVVHIR